MVTIGLHDIDDNVGICWPHVRQLSKPSGFFVPHAEQNTGFKIVPQLVQYLASARFGFLQEAQETAPSVM